MTQTQPRLLVEQIAEAIRGEGISDLIISYGYGIDLRGPEKEIEKSGTVRMIQARNVPGDNLTLSTFGRISTAACIFWSFSKKDRDAVYGLHEMIRTGYKVDNRTGQRATAPFYVGGKCFWKFDPIGSIVETADRFGSVFAAQQAMTLQFENEQF